MLLFVDQNVSAVVSTSTTPYVGYTYSQPSGANYSRLTAMTYPNGRILDYGYTSGIDTTISRISTMADDGGSSAGDHLAEYSYLGLTTIVQQDSPEANTELTYIHQTGDTLSSSDGGDRYTGLDRFGRVIDQYYLNTSTGTATDRLQYGYDRDGNVLYSKNLVNGAFSELYHASSSATGDNNSAYDPLNRLTTFRRGTLTSSGNNGTSLDTVTTANLNSTTGVPNTNSWTLDAVGNQSSAGGISGTFNSQNEQTARGSTSLTYDNAGNMTHDESGYTYTYDAWGHVVNMTNGSTTIALHYDALGRNVIENNGAGNDQQYYSQQRQVVEEKFSGAYEQYVWGLAYVNDLVVRDRNADGSSSGNLGISGSALEEREYFQHNANFSTISYTNQTGTVGQRFIYDPYGSVIALDNSWSVSTVISNYTTYLYQGMHYIGGYEYLSQTRVYDVVLGRWLEQDWAAYIDGANRYVLEDASPVRYVDATGFEPTGMPTPGGGWVGPVPPYYIAPPTYPAISNPGVPIRRFGKPWPMPLPPTFTDPTDEGCPCDAKPAKITKLTRTDAGQGVGKNAAGQAVQAIFMSIDLTMSGDYRGLEIEWTTCARQDGTSGLIPGASNQSAASFEVNPWWDGMYITAAHISYLSCENGIWVHRTAIANQEYWWSVWSGHTTQPW
jgi:RHS repeat-associated protein